MELDKPTKDRKRLSEPDEETDSKKPQIDPELLEKTAKYQRGLKPGSKRTRHKPSLRSQKASAQIEHARNRREQAILDAARTEVLLTEEAGFLEPENEMERTYKVTQRQLKEDLDIASSSKIFDLKLDEFGPYLLDYTPNGRQMLIAGRKGHLATMDWQQGKLGAEFHVRETVRDVSWLHNENMFAVAQKKFVYIYDHSGAEVHCLRKHKEPTALGFLPYHFLLASTGMTGKLMYQDITEGKIIGEHKPGCGPSYVLKVNPYNAVVHMGHTNGTVTMWAPVQSKPLAKMLCHRGPIQAMAMDRGGTYMATSGSDGRVKIWDIRKLKPVHEYVTKRPAHSLDISQRGVLAAGWGPHVTMWRDAMATKVKDPYMARMLPGTQLSSLKFVPYEDVLGYGHSQGVSSIVVPGSGEPNFDAYVANPYQTARQRQESEVKQLLDKLSPDTIQLDPNFIGRLDPRTKAEIQQDRREEAQQQYLQDKAGGVYLDNNVRNKMKGRNSSAKRFARKRQANVMDLKRLAAMEREEKLEREKEKRERAVPESEQGALGKFYDEKRNAQ